MATDSRSIIKALRKHGFEPVRVTGDHHHFNRPGHALLVTVPHPKRDLPLGTISSIEKASGLKLR